MFMEQRPAGRRASARSRTCSRSRTLLVALILIAPTTLLTLAHASPPDQTWIQGIYDDADSDDVVLLLTSATADVSLSGVPELQPISPVIRRLTPKGDRAGLEPSTSILHARAPPSS